MANLIKTSNKSTGGTSFHNCEITATVDEIKAICGDPIEDINDGGDKINFEWNLEMDGTFFTLYDYKYYRPLLPYEPINWHIGTRLAGESNRVLSKLRNILAEYRMSIAHHKTFYEKWNEGIVTNLGKYNTTIFQAYQIADGTNKKKLEYTYPDWFIIKKP